MSFNENNTQNVSGNINKNSNQNYDQIKLIIPQLIHKM